MEEYKGYLSCHHAASELLSCPQTEAGSKHLCQVPFALAALPGLLHGCADCLVQLGSI